jgi:BTB/POZ domain
MVKEAALPERSPSMIEKMKFRRRSDTQSLKKSKETAQANMSANLDSTLYSSGDWSDVTVTCKNHTWRLHKEILVSKCTYFRNRCLTEQNGSQPGVRNSDLQMLDSANIVLAPNHHRLRG